MPRRRALLLTPHPIQSDPRFKRHARALSPDFSLTTCSPGGPIDGPDRHLELPTGQVFARSPRVLTSLAARRFDAALAASPLYRTVIAMREDSRLREFDLLLCSDLETVPLALKLAGDRPVIADLREYYPAQFDASLRWRLMLKPLMVHLTRDVMPRCAAALTVSSGIVDLYESEFNLETVLVTNAAVGRRPKFRPTGDEIRLIHTGVANPARQAEIMIEAAANLPGITLDLYLTRQSHLTRYSTSLETLAASTSNVRLPAAVPQSELPALHDDYDVGLAVFPTTTPQLEHTLPNKFFDYLQAGLAIVGGPGKELRTLTERHHLGPVLESFDVSSLRTLLSQLTPSRVDQWKANSCKAAETLTAEGQGERLLATAHRVLN